MTEPVQQQNPQNPPPEGLWQTVIHALKNMTLTNALVIVLLLAVTVPSYLLYRVINDPEMVGRFLSSYEEIISDKVSCVLRIASLRGGGDTYGISTGFAAQGNDRYVISVLMDRKPSEVEIQSYCATLTAIVDHMRRPETPSPTFPNSDEPLIWHYQLEGSP
jgi:hypothetical protein